MFKFNKKNSETQETTDQGLRGSSCTECESLTDAEPDPAESEFPGTEED